MMKPICFRAWEDICQPKHLGGLGIKNISTVNKSLVTHSAWMVAAQKDSFLSNVLKAKYYPHTSFWKAPSTGSRSVFWSSIQAVKPYINANCTYQLHEGSINIWSEPWCPIWDSIHSHLNLPIAVTPLSNQVKDLWNPADHSWNNELVNQIFDAQAAQGPTGLSTQTLALLNRAWKDKSLQPKLKTFLWRLLRCTPTYKKLFASLQDKVTQVNTGECVSGLGLYLKARLNGANIRVKVQAQTTQAADPIQEEAQAILLALQVTSLLQIQTTTVYSDNQDLTSL
ncbi:hypothetical protein U9M48_018925 [Paspalum notatum var. saurae]|uniref:RNase H type-1 domain-containing protein n=1 Tax=Paspalum notatum var. saurae TaxID=547442 RepID=A0AAQ3TBM5_PASNO